MLRHSQDVQGGVTFIKNGDFVASRQLNKFVSLSKLVSYKFWSLQCIYNYLIIDCVKGFINNYFIVY